MLTLELLGDEFGSECKSVTSDASYSCIKAFQVQPEDVQRLGFGVYGLEFYVEGWGLGFGICGVGYGIWGLDFGV